MGVASEQSTRTTKSAHAPQRARVAHEATAGSLIVLPREVQVAVACFLACCPLALGSADTVCIVPFVVEMGTSLSETSLHVRS